MKPNDKETEYMKMKIINSYQKSSSAISKIQFPILTFKKKKSEKSLAMRCPDQHKYLFNPLSI